jgi:sortase A
MAQATVPVTLMFDRMRLARILGAVGRTFIGVGVLLLLFVAYQLWGTGVQEARAQNRLEDQFEAALEAVTTTEAPRPGGGPTTTTEPDVPPAPIEGNPIAQIQIPSIGVNKYVVEGVGVADLKKAPGHYPQTPLPGQPGNAAIAGHRTTYGAPFYDLNDVDIGDEIIVKTLQGEFTYVIREKTIVQPSQVEVLDPREGAWLTLTTCEPRYSARKRLIVAAELEDEPAPAAPTTTTTTAPAPDEDDDTPALDVEMAGLSGDPTARWPTFWWGLWTTLVAVVVWRLTRWFRPFWVYLAGAPIFLVVLFVFFENVSRLLPANI